MKPSNILVDDADNAKLTDFGIARSNSDPQLTRTGILIGTPAYLSPEIARGREPAPPADVWALGASLFHALEGAAPFGASHNTMQVLYRIGTERPPEPRRAGYLTPW